MEAPGPSASAVGVKGQLTAIIRAFISRLVPSKSSKDRRAACSEPNASSTETSLPMDRGDSRLRGGASAACDGFKLRLC